MTEDDDPIERAEPQRRPMVDPLAEAQLLAAMLADALERARIQRNFDALKDFSPFSVVGRGGRPIGDVPDPGWLPLRPVTRTRGSGPQLPGVVAVPHPRRSPDGVPASGPRPRRSGRR